MTVMATSASLILVGALALAGCAQPTQSSANEALSSAPGTTPQSATPTMPDPAQSECGADQLDEFVGASATDAAIARIRQKVGHERIRTIRPGDAVTMDFRADRLNVEIGEGGRIATIRCG